MVDLLYARLQRRGYLERDVERMVNQDRNVFGSLLLKLGEADAMMTGTTRTFSQTMREVRQRASIRRRGTSRSASICVSAKSQHGVPGRYHRQRAPIRDRCWRMIAEGNRRRRPPSGPGAARRLPVLFDLRQPAGR
jgi:hypothetical protein